MDKEIEKAIEAEVQRRISEKGTEFLPGESLYKIGSKLFVRTITFHYTGRVSHLTDKEMVLEDAAWIASSGRFSNALNTGVLDEVEPYPGPCSINRDTIVDVSPWVHALPREVK